MTQTPRRTDFSTPHVATKLAARRALLLAPALAGLLLAGAAGCDNNYSNQNSGKGDLRQDGSMKEPMKGGMQGPGGTDTGSNRSMGGNASQQPGAMAPNTAKSSADPSMAGGSSMKSNNMSGNMGGMSGMSRDNSPAVNTGGGGGMFTVGRPSVGAPEPALADKMAAEQSNGMGNGMSDPMAGRPMADKPMDKPMAEPMRNEAMPEQVEAAHADIMPAPATKALAATRPGLDQTGGTVTLTNNAGGGVHVHAELTGLAPGSVHGFHIHEKGDLSAPDFSSAGGHYNPTNKPHGAPGADTHVGDFGNITADADGNATLDADTPDTTVKDLVGKAIIVHGYPDDLKSQPSGNADGRIAGGVIKAGK